METRRLKNIIEQLPEEEQEYNVTAKKLKVIFMACYLARTFPDQSQDGWETFCCSHLCHNRYCINALHVVWESNEANLERNKCRK
jgi:hypothetical protein